MKATIESETRDQILDGALTVIQPRAGYRFSVEAVLLARFARADSGSRVLELGAGCGVVSILIAALQHPREIVALEIQPPVAAMIDRNAELNSIPIVRGLCADLRQPEIPGLKPASFDLIVANPPFRALGDGRESPQAGRRAARGATSASLADFIKAARRYAREGARVALVFSAARSAELISGMRANRIEPKRIRFVHPRIEMAASVVLIEGRVEGGIEATVEPPLILYYREGVYSDEARAMLEMK